jgi:hypothetical protein
MPPPGVQVVALPCRGEHADVAGAACTFNELGLCIAESLLPPGFAAECCMHAQQAFDELMHEMAARGIVLGEKTKGGFREIVKRTSGRYEMLYRTFALPLSLPLCASLCIFALHYFYCPEQVWTRVFLVTQATGVWPGHWRRLGSSRSSTPRWVMTGG